MATLPVLNSTSAEDAFLELAQLLTAKQTDADKNPQQVTLFQAFSINHVTQTATLTVSRPVTTTVDATSGEVVVTADEIFLD